MLRLLLVFVLLMVGFAVAEPGLDASCVERRRVLEGRGRGAVTSIVLSTPLILTAIFLQQSGFLRTLDASRQYVADWRSYLASGSYLHAGCSRTWATGRKCSSRDSSPWSSPDGRGGRLASGRPSSGRPRALRW